MCVYNRILLSHKKEWNLAICNDMDGPREFYAKWNESDRGKTNTVWFHLCVESVKQMNTCHKQKESHWYRKQIDSS